MSDKMNQASRLIEIQVVGHEGLVLRSVHVTEAISAPFVLRAEVISLEQAIRSTDLLGKAATVIIRRPDQHGERKFRGFVASLRRLGRIDAGHRTYELEILPVESKLAWRSNCRVFQDKSITEIVSTLAAEVGAPAPMTGSTPTETRPYCIQYNETDYGFMQRLLDSIGCGYYWRVEDGEMQLAHAIGDYTVLPGMPADGYVVSTLAHWWALSGWTLHDKAESGAASAWDYDLERPGSLLQRREASMLDALGGNVEHEVFTWPGGQHLQREPHAHPARVAIERIEAGTETVSAYGHDPAIAAGYKIKADPSGDGTAQGEWLVTSVVHSAHDETHVTDGGGTGYSNAITLMPTTRVFRPRIRTPKPTVPGVQSAIVVGPEGHEIHTDDLGRIKVRFLWDRLNPADDSACAIWVRVAQPAAGKWGGTFFLPRVGDEVLVAFTDGDPDKPVVIGSLYNADSPLDAKHFKQAGENPKSGLRTRSTKNGTAETGHVLRFNDTKDSEEVFFQSERDLNVLVKNARTETINSGDLKGDDTYLLAKGNRKITVAEGNHTTTISKGDHATNVDKGDMKTVVGEGAYDLTVSRGDTTIDVSTGKLSVKVGKGDHVTSVSGGDSKTTVGQGDYAVTVSSGDAKFDVSTGNLTISCGVGSVKIEATQGITLTCGANQVKIDQSGITIKGVMVKIEGTAMANVESPMTTLGGSGMTNVTGAAIMIG